MIRRPPRSTRTDTLFPYTALFRSAARERLQRRIGAIARQRNLRPSASHTSTAPRPSARIFASIFDRSPTIRSEEHTSELQSLMRISYAVFCLKKKKKKTNRKVKRTTKRV